MTAHYKTVVVTLPFAEVHCLHDVHNSQPLSFVGDLIKSRKNLIDGHVHLGYQRPTDTNEMEVVLLPDTTTVAEAEHLIIQVI